MGIEGQTNTRLGAYLLGDVIGRGGMGVVYKATHVHLGREVALKLLAPELSGNDEFRRRFLRESRLAASLDHPNVITVYDAGDSDGTLYIAMRYVEGVDLARFLQDHGPLEPLAAVSLLDQVAAALDAAHEHDLIHRDVKPANVLIASGWCYLTDFGLTKQASAAAASSGLTRAGSFLGTLSYTAPEQIKGREITASVDLYALGCVMHECLTGAPPFTKDSEVALLYAHLSEPPSPPSELRPDLPPAIDGVMAKALAKSPAERYRTCGEFMAAARAAVTQEIEPTAAAQALAPPTVAGAPSGAGEPTGGVAGREARPPPRRRGLTRFIGPTVSRARKQRDTGTLRNSSAGPHEQEVPTIVQPAGGERGSEVAEAGRPGAPGRRGSRRLLILLAAGAAVVAAGVVGVVVASGGGSGKVAAKGGSGTHAGQSTSGQRVLKGAIPVGNSPDQLTSSPNQASTGQASIWTANAGDGTITRIDENSGRVLDTFHYASHSNPAAPMVFWQGALWVGDSRAGTVQELNPFTGKAMGTPIAVGGQPYAMTLAPRPTNTQSGNLWVSNYNDTITRISAGAGSSHPTVFHGLGSGPKPMAPSKNILWVLNLDDGTVTAVNPDTGQMLGTPHHVGGSPAAITYNKWGELWIADRKRDTVTRFNPISWKEIGSPIPVGSRPTRLLSHGCCVWVANFGDGTVTQIDARTGQAFPEIIKITVGGYPSTLTFAGGFWWVGLWSQPTIEFHGQPGGVKRLPGP